ncbi:MAG: dihydroneopterin aldolase [Bacillota bacterium]
MDCFRLKNMVFFGHHGLSPEEKKVGQRIEVDVELYLNLAPVGTADDLALGVNYSQVYERVRRIVEERSFSLLEGMAEAIAGELLAAWKMARVVVRVRKPYPPVGGTVGCAEVEIARPAGPTCRDAGGMV